MCTRRYVRLACSVDRMTSIRNLVHAFTIHFTYLWHLLHYSTVQFIAFIRSHVEFVLLFLIQFTVCGMPNAQLNVWARVRVCLLWTLLICPPCPSHHLDYQSWYSRFAHTFWSHFITDFTWSLDISSHRNSVHTYKLTCVQSANKRAHALSYENSS